MRSWKERGLRGDFVSWKDFASSSGMLSSRIDEDEGYDRIGCFDGALCVEKRARCVAGGDEDSPSQEGKKDVSESGV